MKEIVKKGYKIFWKIFFLPSIDLRYRKQPAIFEHIVSADPEKVFVFVTAFNDPDLIRLHHAAVSKNLKKDCEYFVVDNSTNDGKSVEIRELCVSGNINYVRLPKNPGLDGSLHQGMALNWIHHNFVERFRPWAFGSIDSDLFPVRPVDIAGYLREGDSWGILTNRRLWWRLRRPVFFFWAGLSFFRSEKFKTNLPNFLPTWGLDTGGRIAIDSAIGTRMRDIRDLFSAPTEEIDRGVIVHWFGDFVHFQGSYIEPEHSLALKKKWLEGKLGL